MSLSLLKIGELAKQTGVSVKTIRYYEDCGLLQAAERTEGQFRLFNPQVMERLHFIRRLQGLGLSLQEIGDCLAVYDQGDSPCHNIADKLSAHIQAIDRQLAELTTLRGELVTRLQNWEYRSTPEANKICPNL